MGNTVQDSSTGYHRRVNEALMKHSRRQSPYAPFPGKMREYCLRDANGERAPYKSIWAMDATHANELYTAARFNIESVMYGLHVSSVRRIDDETDETLRPIEDDTPAHIHHRLCGHHSTEKG